MMKKENYRDYITEAFRFYAANNGEITDDMSKAEKEDITAVKNTLSWFRFNRKQHIENAIKAVYFVSPAKPLKKGDITGRVIKYSIQISAEERTVYRWLEEARNKCAYLRNLRLEKNKAVSSRT